MTENTATHKNILAIREHSKETRKFVRVLEKKIIDISNSNTELSLKLNILQIQIQNLQVKFFTGGSTK